MTPLRKRMAEEMNIRNFSPHTQRAYLAAVTRLAKFFNQSPDTLDREHVRKFLVHLVEEEKLLWGSYNVHLCALRFFYQQVLGQETLLRGIRCPKEHTRLPYVLSFEEVHAVLNAHDNLRDRAPAHPHLCHRSSGQRGSSVEGHRYLIRFSPPR